MLLVEVSSLLLLCLSAAADQQKITVKPGDEATLQCHCPRDAAFTQLEWTRLEQKSDGYVFFYRNNRLYEKYQHPSFRDRVELRDPQMKSGDVSVTVKNVTINDTGTYKCQIIINGERKTTEFSSSVSLTVTDSGEVVESRLRKYSPDSGPSAPQKLAEKKDEGNTGVVLAACLPVAGLLLIIALVFISYKLINKKMCPNRENIEGRWTSCDTNISPEPMC